MRPVSFTWQKLRCWKDYDRWGVTMSCWIERKLNLHTCLFVIWFSELCSSQNTTLFSFEWMVRAALGLGELCSPKSYSTLKQFIPCHCELCSLQKYTCLKWFVYRIHRFWMLWYFRLSIIHQVLIHFVDKSLWTMNVFITSLIHQCLFQLRCTTNWTSRVHMTLVFFFSFTPPIYSEEYWVSMKCIMLITKQYAYFAV